MKKICKCCEKELPIQEFDKKYAHYTDSICRSCRSIVRSGTYKHKGGASGKSSDVVRKARQDV